MNRLLHGVLKQLVKRGSLTVTWSDKTVTRYGATPGRSVDLRVLDGRAEWTVFLNPELGLGEAYMNGQFDIPSGSIADLLALFSENYARTRATAWMEILHRCRMAVRGWRQHNTSWRSRQNVAHHYDLDERFYRLFLDPDLQYSCAYFKTPDLDLAAAQAAKKRHIAAKLDLRSGQEVLDIGSGWGGLGMFIAKASGAHVTGVTLSTEQHRVSTARALHSGLAGRARFEVRDYRTLEGDFDRIVSVGMFEHVGVGHYAEFFKSCARLLKPDGVMLLHSIGRSDGPGATNAFVQKYIFPGGYIPALSEILPAIESSGLWVTDVEILRLHYADTLKAWRENFLAHWDEAAELYDERFCRMWEFYLAGSEASFRQGTMMVFQIQLSRRRDTLPITRDYMLAAEVEPRAMHSERESLRIAGA